MSNTPKEVLGIFITQQEVSNMKVENIHVSDFAIQTILKTVNLVEEAQFDAVDKLVARTPDWFKLSEEEQTNKIKTVLLQETVIEYLRLNQFIKEDVTMVDVGIDKEGSVIVSAYYVEENDLLGKIQVPEMTEEELNKMEAEINIIDSSIDIVAEAEKRIQKMKEKNNVIPFKNRSKRRKEKRGFSKK